MKKKSIWFVNKDAAPLNEYGTHLRTVKQCQFFQRQGYDVKLFCSSIVHNTNINHVDKGLFKEVCIEHIPFVFIKTIRYGNSTFRRIIAYFLFAIQLWRVKKHFVRPDVIVHTSRIPFDIPIYYLAKHLKCNYILDITDLWPMEFEHFGFLSSKNPVMKLFYSIERFLYTKADQVVMSMQGAHEYIISHRWDTGSGGTIDLKKVHYINNGIDLLEFDSNKNNFSIDDDDLNNPHTFKVIYLGSIRLANNLDQLINAASILRAHQNIKFLIYGDGTERTSLETKCIQLGLDNVIFKNKWVLPQYVPYILSKASINVLNYSSGWAPYGGSMNKMFMAFASGRPILCNAGMKYSPIRDNHIGLDQLFSSPNEYAEAILSLYNMNTTDIENVYTRSRNLAKQFDIPYLNEMFKAQCGL